MPARNVQVGWQWGTPFQMYPTKSQAEAQGRAAYASGYREKKK